jgi:hypothetical protein
VRLFRSPIPPRGWMDVMMVTYGRRSRIVTWAASGVPSLRGAGVRGSTSSASRGPLTIPGNSKQETKSNGRWHTVPFCRLVPSSAGSGMRAGGFRGGLQGNRHHHILNTYIRPATKSCRHSTCTYVLVCLGQVTTQRPGSPCPRRHRPTPTRARGRDPGPSRGDRTTTGFPATVCETQPATVRGRALSQNGNEL